MLKFITANLDAGIKKIKNNPQLIYTIVVAVIIAGAFIFMANRFIGIAIDAQERLINVRVGSIQDVFVSFAVDHIDDRGYLNSKISEVVSVNKTIKNFKIIAKKSPTDQNAGTAKDSYIIIASSDAKEIGSDSSENFLYSLATSNPADSLTVRADDGTQRLFKTTRAIVGPSGDIAGVAIITQTLSQADEIIQKNITNSIILLVAIVFVVMLLFLRHARIIDYMDLYKKLREVDQLKDDFISMASHELRTPLSVIRGYADLIRTSPEMTAVAKDYSVKIDSSAKELDYLVSDILDVSRIEQGRMSFKIEKINPIEVIEEIVSSFVFPAKEKGLNVSFDKSNAGGDWHINADKNRLKQILVNLVGNAVKYTAKGEVKVSQYIESNKMRIDVADTGIGISAEEREKLFGKFYRIRNKETESIGGTGLGLWITAQIVKEMGGDISVESIKGVGSHFIVSFPIAE